MDQFKLLKHVLSFSTALASINLGVTAMFEEGLLQMAGASHAQVLTGWYLLAFLGAFQLILMTRREAEEWSR